MKVSTNANFPQDLNCKQVFIFQRNLMLVIDKKDSLAFTKTSYTKCPVIYLIYHWKFIKPFILSWSM